MRVFLKASFEDSTMLGGWAIAVAMGETVFLWLAASWVFGKIDVAVAVD